MPQPTIFFLVVVLFASCVIATKRVAPAGTCTTYTVGTSGAAVWQRPTKPILLVPGIGGTALWADDNNFNDLQKVWLTNVNADCYSGSVSEPWSWWGKRATWSGECVLPQYLFSHFNATNFEVDSIETKYKIHPLEDNFGLCGIDDLATNLPDTSTYVFTPMIRYLTSIGYVPGRTLFGYPYDWRNIESSNGETLASDLTSYVTSIAQRTHSNVTVITHSMGGLLMQLHTNFFGNISQFVDTWIAVAAPFKGAPTAMNAFVQGYNLGDVSTWGGLSNATGHQMMMQWPSAYMLLPSAYWEWQNGSPSVAFMSPSYKQKTYLNDNYQYMDALRQVNQLNYVHYDFAGVTESFPNPLDDDITKIAEIFHHFWSLPNTTNINFVNIAYGGQPTAYNFTYFLPDESWFLPKAWGTTPYVTYVPGDGTVPLESAIADDAINATHKDFILLQSPGLTHQTLLWSRELFGNIRHVLGLDCNIESDWTTPNGNFYFADTTLNGTVDINGQIWKSGTYLGKQYSVSFSDDCMSFSGYLGTQQWNGTRVLEAMCSAGATSPCSIDNGQGVKKCFYGDWSYTCYVASCNSGCTIDTVANGCIC